MKSDSIRRRTLILLLYSAGRSGTHNEPVLGITRLQKLLFLVSQDQKVKRILEDSYEFLPYRYGPYSPQLYDDVEYLESFGIIEPEEGGVKDKQRQRGEVRLPSSLMALTKRRTATTSDIVDARAGFDYILENGADSTVNSEYELRTYRLTPYGIKHAERSLGALDMSDARALERNISEIKQQFAHLPLRALLRSVYKDFPEFTTESEIANQL